VSHGIYVASKTVHAPRWLDARAAGLPISSTWIDEAGVGDTSDWPDLWQRCIKEASHSAALVLYQEAGEALKGALVETGAALAGGARVYYVGNGMTKQLSVVHHPRVLSCGSLAQAWELALRDHREQALGGASPEPAAAPRAGWGDWQLVAEALPPLGRSVLVWCARSPDIKEEVGGYFGADGWYTGQGKIDELFLPTHWAELPPRPLVQR
jgi:hypothetical protein